MARVLFARILERGRFAGIVPNKTKRAITWYRNRAQEVKSARPKRDIVGDPDRTALSEQLQPRLGTMLHFFYEPKGMGTGGLPFWDRFPLVFPIEERKDGFLGINMHYLPLELRAGLMDQLYALASDDTFTTKTHLRATYNVLNRALRFKEFRPTIKRYLAAHIRSKLMVIEPREWDIALFLPTERFRGARKQSVWNDSKERLGLI